MTASEYISEAQPYEETDIRYNAKAFRDGGGTSKRIPKKFKNKINKRMKHRERLLKAHEKTLYPHEYDSLIPGR